MQLIFVLACLPLGLILLRNRVPFGIGLTAVGAFFAMQAFTIVFHELGHWIAARLVNYRVVKVTIGSGPLVKAAQLFGTSLQFRRFPTTGSTLSYAQTLPPRKWRQAIMLLGGVTANAVVAATLATFMAWHLAQGFPRSPAIVSLLAGAIFSEVLVIISNLWPRRFSGLGNITASDGQHLLDLYRAKDFNATALNHRSNVEFRELAAQGRFAEAAAVCEQRRLACPSDPLLFGQALHTLERASGARAAFDFYRAHIGEVDAKDAQRAAWVKANAAWHALLTRDSSLLGDAGSLSEEAFEVLPTVAEIRGTRGAYLTQTGRHERALPLLLDGVRKVEDKIDRADFARFLATCHEGLNQPEVAVELGRLSDHFRAQATR